MRCPLTFLAFMLAASTIQPALVAGQPAADQACGDGTTFTVDLPAVGATVGGDSVTLPNGCRIYALLVSGYSRNKNFDELTFYKLAKFVMENGGYVHWAWWNNLLKEYMERPLHRDTFTRPLTGEVLSSSPGGLNGVHVAGFVPPNVVDVVPKAIPEEDRQFQADALRMLAAIRQRNPSAIIVVAGHSMGGDAVARLGASATVPTRPTARTTGPGGERRRKSSEGSDRPTASGVRRHLRCAGTSTPACSSRSTAAPPWVHTWIRRRSFRRGRQASVPAPWSIPEPGGDSVPTSHGSIIVGRTRRCFPSTTRPTSCSATERPSMRSSM
jgi:hypothetical protein